MGRPKERTPELRQRVLGAAVTVLEAEGFAAFTARRVAAAGSTSTAALYELFGDKAGLVRAVLFSGFAQLSEQLRDLPETTGERADLVAALEEIRRFIRDHPALAEVMFSRPFPDFDPRPDASLAERPVRELLGRRVRRCTEAGVLVGPETDVAPVLLALVQGLACQERGGSAASSKGAFGRRWTLAFEALLGGLARPSTLPQALGGPRGRVGGRS